MISRTPARSSGRSQKPNKTYPESDMVIYELACNVCDYRAGSFTRQGGMFVSDDDGKRIICQHPLESWTVDEVLGIDATQESRASRIGHFHYWLCLGCQQESIVDQEHDTLNCTHCGSLHGGFFRDLGGHPCPNCTSGQIVIIDSGLVI